MECKQHFGSGLFGSDTKKGRSRTLAKTKRYEIDPSPPSLDDTGAFFSRVMEEIERALDDFSIKLRLTAECFGLLPLFSFSFLPRFSSLHSLQGFPPMATSEDGGSCVVCGKATFTRCSSCLRSGLDWMFFCSKDHQKLVSTLSMLIRQKLTSVSEIDLARSQASVRIEPFQMAAFDAKRDRRIRRVQHEVYSSELDIVDELDQRGSQGGQEPLQEYRASQARVQGTFCSSFENSVNRAVWTSSHSISLLQASLEEVGPSSGDLSEELTSRLVKIRSNAFKYRVLSAYPSSERLLRECRPLIAAHPFDYLAYLDDFGVPDVVSAPSCGPWLSNFHHRFLIYHYLYAISAENSVARYEFMAKAQGVFKQFAEREIAGTHPNEASKVTVLCSGSLLTEYWPIYQGPVASSNCAV